MSAHVLLNLLKEITCEAGQACYLFFAMSLINSVIQEHECYILFITRHKFTLKSHFYLKTSRFCMFTQHYNEHHYARLQNL